MIITEGKPYRRANDQRWVAPYSVDGRRGGTYAASRKQAVEKRTEVLDRLRTTGLGHTSRVKVEAYVAHWMDTTLKASGRSIGTQALYRSQLEHHVVPAIGHLALGDVSPQEIERLILTLGQKLAPSTVRVTYSAAKAVFTTAVRDKLIGFNPVAAVPSPKVPKTEAHYLRPEQVAKVVEAVRGHRLEAVFLLYLATGLRRGEVLGLRWSDLDGDQLYVRRAVRRIEGHGLTVGGRKSDRAPP
jgi:site-specific recombinase XerD